MRGKFPRFFDKGVGNCIRLYRLDSPRSHLKCWKLGQSEKNGWHKSIYQNLHQYEHQWGLAKQISARAAERLKKRN